MKTLFVITALGLGAALGGCAVYDTPGGQLVGPITAAPVAASTAVDTTVTPAQTAPVVAPATVVTAAPPAPVVVAPPAPVVVAPPAPVVVAPAVVARPPYVWVPAHYGPYGRWIPGHWRYY
ncbi:hypothetical protein [Caballeronia sp. LZ034LL]|uniref:hypothetical protein n=1 Tax=Caballeronia sp. LZ034LL TaxID=3038567 RepID=UPI002855B673|nr:hypothetical protein [Caballeronia sp. LZ034LL]MDR5836290.1 hypothetical protein [Caballeronia sp. LZ034LL]